MNTRDTRDSKTVTRSQPELLQTSEVLETPETPHEDTVDNRNNRNLADIIGKKHCRHQDTADYRNIARDTDQRH